MKQSILPPNENLDERTIEALGSQILEKFDTSKLNINPMSCDKSLLPHLAIDFDTNIVGLDEDESRRLLQNSRAIKRYIGSKYAVRKAAESIYGKFARAIPFYEYDGDPGKYKIEVEVTEEKAVNQVNLLKTKRVVEDANRESCTFEGFVISMKVENTAKYKIGSISSEITVVLPKRIENIILNVDKKTLVASHSIETAYIKPLGV